MNKLAGFLELTDSGLPSIHWELFKPGKYLDPNILWTVRTAIKRGNDLNLPRKVGVIASEAYESAMQFYENLHENGIVIVYPYFIANKSGTLEVGMDKIIIEAVKDDLWNLVTYNKKNVTIIDSSKELQYDGEQDFLTHNELSLLMKQVALIKRKFSSLINSGNILLFEWSFANTSDVLKRKIGNEYLIFYEMRTI